jgi:hypothetical protein
MSWSDFCVSLVGRIWLQAVSACNQIWLQAVSACNQIRPKKTYVFKDQSGYKPKRLVTRSDEDEIANPFANVNVMLMSIVVFLTDFHLIYAPLVLFVWLGRRHQADSFYNFGAYMQPSIMEQV